MLVRNTNEAYGDPGPWETDSKGALADEMKDIFKVWAHEAWNKAWDDVRDGLPEPEETEEVFKARVMAEMRAEFIAGLKESEVN